MHGIWKPCVRLLLFCKITVKARSISWQEIHGDFRRRIISGQWSPGMLIPGEQELALELGCARTTVNRALRELAACGAIDRKRKAGTRVVSQRSQKVSADIPVIRLQVESRQQVYSFELRKQSHCQPPPQVALRMKLSAKDEALFLRTIHFADTRPFAFEERWVNTETVPMIMQADLEQVSANEWLVSQVPLSHGELQLSAIAASKTVARTLKIEDKSPLLKMERLTWLEGKSVTAATIYHVPDHQLRLEF